METSTSIQLKTLMLALYLCFAALSFSHCDARRSMHLLKGGRGSIIKPTKKIQVSRNLDMDPQLDASNTQPYVSSPFSLAPYDSLPPIPLPEIAPPFCVYPPSTPQLSPPTGGGYTPSLPPPSSSSTPPLPFLSPPSSPGTVPGSPESIPSPIPNPPESIPSPIPNPNPNPNPPPEIFPSPPTSTVPSPPTFVPSPTGPALSPPYYYEPTPPTFVPSPTGPTLSPPNYYEPSPPTFIPSPTGPALSPPYYYEPSPPSNVVPSPPGPFIFVPSPPVFQPPVVYPPPAVPPPPKRGPSSALWCVAKPTVPDPIIQEAMNYACGSGADCDSIQPNGSCFHPNTLLAHASYAFNSYWQRSKVAGGRCEFGGTAMLVTVDPSYDGCHFVYY